MWKSRLNAGFRKVLENAADLSSANKNKILTKFALDWPNTKLETAAGCGLLKQSLVAAALPPSFNIKTSLNLHD